MCSSGRALARPHRLELEQWVEEQIGWAASAEKPSAQYLEAFAFRRGKAMEGAGGLPSCRYECMPLSLRPLRQQSSSTNVQHHVTYCSAAAQCAFKALPLAGSHPAHV